MKTKETLETMTVKELRKIVVDNELVGISKSPKSVLIDTLVEYIKEGLYILSKKDLQMFAQKNKCMLSLKLTKEKMVDKIMDEVSIIK